jgi:uncharacterized protein YutE (UPF0331/DUF86 family)
MLDRERILGKIDVLDAYLSELAQIIPVSFKDYLKVEKKRSCERLLQLSIECVMDICKLFVVGLRLGLPAEENDILDKMRKKGIISSRMHTTLKKMRGLRNILVHEYTAVDDEFIFKTAKTKLGDFRAFKKEILKTLNKIKARS